jgi:hypothetical protein
MRELRQGAHGDHERTRHIEQRESEQDQDLQREHDRREDDTDDDKQRQEHPTGTDE